jgi:cell division protein FtsZ
MAISSPLLEASIDGAHGVLLSIQGGSDLGLFEINEAAQLVSNSAAVDANIIFGAVIDDALGDEVRVTVIAAGFDENQIGRAAPASGAFNAGPASDRAASSRDVPPPRPNSGPASPSGTGASSYAATPVASPAASYSSAPSPAQASAPQASPARAGEQTVPWFAAGEADTPAPTATPSVVAGHVIEDEEPAATPGVSASELASDGLAETADAAGAPAGERTATPEAAASDHANSDGADPDTGDHEAPVSAARPSEAAASSSAAGNGASTSAARVFDVATTRRRPVIFEEDDDLDVPDFLK